MIYCNKYGGNNSFLQHVSRVGKNLLCLQAIFKEMNQSIQPFFFVVGKIVGDYTALLTEHLYSMMKHITRFSNGEV